ncbi:TetR/AcrR family transcriptional regulator [Kribbella sp. NPDC051770]|uniref:TetR/AcrR family transcriptional regulator n=1 Tax=Kribbella sp. NPDC051770 TaxID=3155413 RepID=UPI003446FDFB
MSTAPSFDRRARRREQTIDEILAAAVRLMEAEGVAGLSLSAVAREVGMRPPSLYQYFPSKMAIYDALFRRGAEAFRDVRRETVRTAVAADPLELERICTIEFGRWCMANPIHSQLLFWRTVPGFTPSPEAYAPAQETMEDLRGNLRAAVAAGLLHPDAVSDDGIALYTSVTAGVLSQQLANEPDASYDDGRFTRLLPAVLEMFQQRYAPPRG